MKTGNQYLRVPVAFAAQLDALLNPIGMHYGVSSGVVVRIFEKHCTSDLYLCNHPQHGWAWIDGCALGSTNESV
jgi:hypothetical protein